MIFTMEYSGVEGSDKYVIETHGNDLTADDYVEVFRKMLFLLEFDIKTIDDIFTPHNPVIIDNSDGMKQYKW